MAFEQGNQWRFKPGNKLGVHNGAPVKSQGPDIVCDVDYVPSVGFERLCSAVVAQAAKDKAWWFFESEAIRLYLSDKVDPLELMWQIKENYKLYGRWSATDTKAKGWYSKEREDDIL